MSVKSTVLDSFRKLLANERSDRILSRAISSYPNFSLLRKLIPGNHLYPKNSNRESVYNGIKFLLDLSDYPDWSLYFHNQNDSSKGVLNYVKEGDVIFDVGGNIGQTALMLAQKVGDTGKVISFEPFPSTIEKFNSNLSRNKNITNITLETFGLGNKIETLKMDFVCDTNSAANRIIPFHSAATTNVSTVEINVLDVYLANLADLQKIDLIKIDVEGFEYQVLEGAKSTLLKFKPDLFIEINDWNLKAQGASAKQLLSFLKDFNYDIVDVSSNKKIFTVEDLETHTDIYCTMVKV